MQLGGNSIPTHALEVGNRKVASLVVDFLGECAEYHKIRFHAPVLFGLRQMIGLRGIYLAEGFKVGRNRPILTVPFSGMLGADNVLQQPNAPQHISLETIMGNMLDEELKPLATHVLLGAHMAHQNSILPRATSAAAMKNVEDMSRAEYEARLELFTGAIMPWARMIDDENFSEEHVLGMYRSALDKWQMQDYADIYMMFNRNITHLHGALKMECRLEDLRRITRVVIARTEQVPTAAELTAGRATKMSRKLLRALKLQAAPRPDLRMIPMIDMVNHSNRANTWVRFTADGAKAGLNVPGPCATLYALNDIEGGAELCRYYNFALGRGNALFRYGFLPFEMMSLEHFDPWKEHYVKGIAPNLSPESDEEQAKRAEVEREVARLQECFRTGRGGSDPRRK